MHAIDEVEPAQRSAWWRNRFVWVAAILLVVTVTIGTMVNVGTGPGTTDTGGDLAGQLNRRLVTVLEEIGPERHQGHSGHAAPVAGQSPNLVCGVRVFGYEPAEATTIAAVHTAYGFHLCGMVEAGRPWDWAVKLVGPIVVGMSTDPPTVTVAEATAEVTFTDRVRQLFPQRYQEEALRESLGGSPMRELRERYDAASGT